jgi:hypothetical protein
MAWAIISGLLASTVLTLLVVPAVCVKVIKAPVAEPESSSQPADQPAPPGSGTQ